MKGEATPRLLFGGLRLSFETIIVWGVLIGLTILLLYAVVNGRMSNRGSSIASITAFHDMQPKDKQGAVEILLEQKAGKQWEQQESGEGKQEGVQKEEKRQL